MARLNTSVARGPDSLVAAMAEARRSSLAAAVGAWAVWVWCLVGLWVWSWAVGLGLGRRTHRCLGRSLGGLLRSADEGKQAEQD